MTPSILLAILISTLAGIAIGVLIAKTTIGQRFVALEARIANEADGIVLRGKNDLSALKSHTTAEAASVTINLKAAVADVKKDVAAVKDNVAATAGQAAALTKTLEQKV